MPRKSHLLRSLVKHFVTRSRGMHRGSGINLAGGRRRYRRVGGARRRTINPYGASHSSSASNAKSFINRNGKKIAMGVALVGTAALAAKFGPQVASAVGPVLRQAAASVHIPSVPRPRVVVGARDVARAAYNRLASQINEGRAARAAHAATTTAAAIPLPPTPVFAPRSRSVSSLSSDILSSMPARSRSGSSVGFVPRGEGAGRRHRKMRGGALRLAGHQGSLCGPVHVGISKMGLTNLPQAY